jgi:ArsR family transcriptional regulator
MSWSEVLIETPYIDERQCPNHRDSDIDVCQYVGHTRVMSRSPALPLLDAVCCAPLVRQPLTAAAATDLVRTLKAIADPARLRLLSMIAVHEGGEACVCDLTEPLGLSQPTVSHHLKVLADAGLLTRDKRGVWAYFTLVPGALDSLAAVLSTQGINETDTQAV